MKAYAAQELPKRIQAFEACASPTEEAKCDSALFLRKYFLDKNGNPDRTKTPDLMLLPGYYGRGLAMTGRTERVPALHVADGGLEGASHVTVVGWNRQRVNNNARDIDMQQTDGRGILRSSHDWHGQMMIHQRYIEKLRTQVETSNPQIGTSFHRSNLTGGYVVKCSRIQYGWPILSKNLSARGFWEGRVAILDLGIMFGLILLGRTKAAVTKIVQEKDWGDDNEGEDMSSEEEDGSDESDTPVELTSDRPAKRQKIDVDHPRRLYFQWRGYNTVSVAVYFDPQNCNTGHLDFADDDATTFEGKICIDAGTTVEFQGYKVSGIGGPLTMNWNGLSHLASERAKAPEYMYY